MMYISCIHIINNYSQVRVFGALKRLLFFRRRISFACSLEFYYLSARWVTDMGLIKYFDVLFIKTLGTVQES